MEITLLIFSIPPSLVLAEKSHVELAIRKEVLHFSYKARFPLKVTAPVNSM